MSFESIRLLLIGFGLGILTTALNDYYIEYENRVWAKHRRELKRVTI